MDIKKNAVKRFFCLLLWLIVLFPLNADDDKDSEKEKPEISTVTIESAKKSDYKKDSDGSEYIVFTGDVVLSVVKGSKTTYIKADYVTYNRARSTLFAEGGVSFSQSTEGASNEALTASSLYFNTETLEGVFDDGRVVQNSSSAINLKDGSKLVVFSDLFGRENSGTVTFKNGTLTFCEDENPHWKIKASRIWLLPGNEFSFANGLLYVGQLPVMYFPFFYYPKDEMIFNPVFGYDMKRGYFAMTTTYLVGRKPLESGSDDDGLFSFMRATELKKQKREGLFLRNLEEKDTMPDTSFKIVGDAYSNLGYLTGFEGKFKPSSIVTKLDMAAYFGFSSTIFPLGSDGLYTTYLDDGSVNYDKSLLFGTKVPFRYYFNMNVSLTKSPFNISLAMPVYSDIYFKQDFLDRKETMDWINFMLKNPALTNTDKESSSSGTVSSYSWSLNGSISTPSFLKVLKPVINDFSLSSISSSITFNSKTLQSTDSFWDDISDYSSSIQNDIKTYSPMRSFFYPSNVYPVKASMRISGTLIDLNTASTKTAAKTKSSDISGFEMPEEFKPEDKKTAEKTASETEKGETDIAAADSAEEEAEQVAETETAAEAETLAEAETGAEETETEESEEARVFDVEEIIPNLKLTSDSIKTFGGFNYKLTYSVSPTFSNEMNFMEFKSPDDIDFNNSKSIFIKVTAPVNVSSSAGILGDFIKLTNSFDFSPVYQEHPYISEDPEAGYYDVEGVETSNYQSLVKTDYMARVMDLKNSNSLSFKPFLYTEHFKGSSLSWNSSLKLIKTDFKGTWDAPEWFYRNFFDKESWDEEVDDEKEIKNYITSHNMTMVLSATEAGSVYSQSLTLKANLPPLVESYSGTLSMKFKYITSLSVSTTYKKESDKEDAEWVFTPLTQSCSIKLGDKISFSENYSYNLKDSYHDSLSFGLSGYGASVSYSHKYTQAYKLTENGWVKDNEAGDEGKLFMPYSLSFSYSMPSKNLYAWYNRISLKPTLSTSINMDLIRTTNSSFSITPGLTFNINNFLNLSISASSKNSVIFRYLQEYFDTDGVEIPGEKNVFKDLYDSFAFWDENKRKASGFKMKSLSINLTHELHDWTFASEFTVSPRLEKGKYDYSPYFSMAVVWRPMASIKTKIEDKYGEFTLNPSDD